MFRKISLILSSILIVLSVTGCGQSTDEATKKADSTPLTMEECLQFYSDGLNSEWGELTDAERNCVNNDWVASESNCQPWIDFWNTSGSSESPANRLLINDISECLTILTPTDYQYRGWPLSYKWFEKSDYAENREEYFRGWAMFIQANEKSYGCPGGVYAEANILDSNGTIIDYTNDLLPNLSSAQKGILRFNVTSDNAKSIELTNLTCN